MNSTFGARRNFFEKFFFSFISQGLNRFYKVFVWNTSEHSLNRSFKIKYLKWSDESFKCDDDEDSDEEKEEKENQVVASFHCYLRFGLCMEKLSSTMIMMISFLSFIRSLLPQFFFLDSVFFFALIIVIAALNVIIRYFTAVERKRNWCSKLFKISS